VIGGLDAGEERMARWLAEREYPFEFQPSWGVRTCPDFRVRHGSNVVAIEVETIAGWGMFRNVRFGEHGSRPMAEALKPLREKIRAAARQLKPLAGAGIPRVIAVANPYNRPVPFGAELMISAMYGDPAYKFDSDEETDRVLLDRNGKLTNDHPYISAVALVREESDAAVDAAAWYDKHRSRFSSPEAMAAEARATGLFDTAARTRVTIDFIDTVSASPRVSATFANGPNDRRWSPTADGSGVERVR